MTRDQLRKALDDPETTVESLGEQQLDGRKVVGFRFTSQRSPMTVWADPGTSFPVRIQATMVGPPQTKVAMWNYELNVELDESLFSLSVPDGYTILETDVDASTPAEKDLLEAPAYHGRRCRGGVPGEP